MITLNQCFVCSQVWIKNFKVSCAKQVFPSLKKLTKRIDTTVKRFWKHEQLPPMIQRPSTFIAHVPLFKKTLKLSKSFLNEKRFGQCVCVLALSDNLVYNFSKC